MKKKHWKILGWIVVGALLVVYLLLPVGVGIFATFRYPETVDDAPSGFEEITMTTSDDIELKAWYAPAQNGSAVLILHGATSSREGVRNHALLLASRGYGVLAVDLRGHGESGGDGVTGFGWKSELDIEASLSFLTRQDPHLHLHAIGLSMGAEALLSAASRFPQIESIVSEGATHRSIQDYLALSSRENLFVSFTTRVMYLSASLWGQTNAPKPMLTSIQEATDTRFYFISAKSIQDEIDYNEVYYTSAQDRSRWWNVPEGGHTEALKTLPEEYEAKVIGFLEEKTETSLSIGN
ncbi:MAG TPA: hypothetical protein DCQ90_04910 [Erysipelotrichaceae bacterium]|nr:hypothetical protein [Erysipelotrichaceae bacterium]